MKVIKYLIFLILFLISFPVILIRFIDTLILAYIYKLWVWIADSSQWGLSSFEKYITSLDLNKNDE